jgi:hypothetical protein
MNALRDLGYFVLFLAVILVSFEVMGHCQDRKLEPDGHWHYLPEYKPKQHFWQKHPTRTKVLTVLGMGAIGAVVAIVQNHNGVCPNTAEYHGGTPPCPK